MEGVARENKARVVVSDVRYHPEEKQMDASTSRWAERGLQSCNAHESTTNSNSGLPSARECERPIGRRLGVAGEVVRESRWRKGGAPELSIPFNAVSGQ